MLAEVGKIQGRLGTAELFRRAPESTDETATLVSWLVSLPHTGLPWGQWMLCVVHLREIPGERECYHQYEGSEYELMLMALDPTHPATVGTLEDPDTPIVFLTPPSGVFQFHNGGRDDLAISMCAEVAGALVSGVLPPEPAGDPGATMWWRQCIAGTAAHDRGEHG